MKISRIDAIKIIDRATDRDDPHWEQVTEDWYDESKDDVPSINDVFAALGVTEAEYREASGADGKFKWPKQRGAQLEGALRDIAHGNWSSPNVDSEAANVYAQIVNEMQARARAALANN